MSRKYVHKLAFIPRQFMKHLKEIRIVKVPQARKHNFVGDMHYRFVWYVQSDFIPINH